jgi:hypothetical protein
MPSGKTHTASPVASARSTSANVSAFFAVSTPSSRRRYTGIAPAAFSSSRSGVANSVDFARNLTSRSAVVQITAGSSREFGWFGRRRIAPCRGANPTRSIR